MATTSAYDYGIRNALTQKGVDNSKIGYNNSTGMVTVGGQDFMKADKNYAGTAFTNQQNFNSAWDQYNKLQQQPAPTVQATSYGQPQPSYGQTPARSQQAPQQYNPYQQAGQQNPYTQQTDTVIQQLLNYGQNQQKNPYTAQADAVIQQLLNYGQNQSNFDPYSSSGYAAAQAQAQRAARQNTRAAQEAYGSAGFGRSTGLGERVAGINNDATEYLMTQVVPQLEAQEQARRQQEYNNILSALSPLMNQQGRVDQLDQQGYNNTLNSLMPLMNQQGRADQLVQQEFDNNLAVTDRTGNYKPQGSDQLINQLLALKGQAETKGITAADRSVLSGQADVLRAQLQAMGVDTSSLGANVSKANAAAESNLGTRTLAGQQLDEGIRQYDQNFNRDVFESDRNFKRAEFESDRDYNFAVGQQEWENNFNSEQFNWQKAQQAWENTFQEKNFQQSMQEAAASRGLQWASLNQRQKETIADNAFREKQFRYQQEQDAIANDLTAQKLNSPGEYNYKTDPDFMEDVAAMVKDPTRARQELRDNSEAYTNKYGVEGYNYLITTVNK